MAKIKLETVELNKKPPETLVLDLWNAQWFAEGSFASKQNFSFFEHQQQTTNMSRTKRGE